MPTDLSHPSIYIAEVAEGKKNSLKHFFCHCSISAKAWLRILGKQFLEDLKKVSSCKGKELLFFGLALKTSAGFALLSFLLLQYSQSWESVASKRRSTTLIGLIGAATDNLFTALLKLSIQ